MKYEYAETPEEIEAVNSFALPARDMALKHGNAQPVLMALLVGIEICIRASPEESRDSLRQEILQAMTYMRGLS